MPAGKRRAQESGQLVLPATSANLGPAFDAAALAFSLYLRVRGEPANEYSVSARGRDAHLCGGGAENLILKTYREVLLTAGQPAAPLHLEVINEIPIGKGCGSSAAARLAGIALAVRIGGLDWSAEQIIAEASQREGHPDNAAACWLGGLSIARNATAADGSPAVQAARIAGSCPWPLLLAIPDEPLSTEEARRVLPGQYSRADAVFNVQNALFLLASFTQGRTDLLRSALQDRIHEPYRAPLCPLLPALRELAGSEGILGAVLSGAGPSVLLFLQSEIAASKAIERVSNHLRGCGLQAELLLTSLAENGASVTLRRATTAHVR
ncbi:MAG TPA: homoserine kinase [Terriglobales bacterium]|nr:homoserine kinase [Terriglobales bacterium]